MFYAIDYNKELMNQLKQESKTYEEILGISTERDEQAFWEHVQAERQRFINFLGVK